jgi:hypothetical protein
MDILNYFAGNKNNFATSIFITGLGLTVAGISIVTVPGYKMFTLSLDDAHYLGFAWGCCAAFMPAIFWIAYNRGKQDAKIRA